MIKLDSDATSRNKTRQPLTKIFRRTNEDRELPEEEMTLATLYKMIKALKTNFEIQQGLDARTFGTAE